MKTALITFHAPYNYGSVLQAYALQNALTKLGYENEIINYRFQGQKDAYRLIRKTDNKADLVKDLLQFPVWPKKKRRADKFEKFIAGNLNMTREFNSPEELASLANSYDVFISGSDQIWNKHANELDRVDWEYMGPYLLSFTSKPKISYASSVGGTTDEEILDNMKGELDKFSRISARESSVAKRLSGLLGTDVENVCDPTLLLTKEDYVKRFDLSERKGNYIFYYSLAGINTVKRHLEWIRKEYGNDKMIIVNTPYAFIPGNKKRKNVVALDPGDFLQYILSADVVVTDSYHGTLFSVNFGKDFVCLCNKSAASDYRKSDILGRLGLTKHMVDDFSRPRNVKDFMNRSDYYDKLDAIRKESYDYLRQSLELAE